MTRSWSRTAGWGMCSSTSGRASKGGCFPIPIEPVVFDQKGCIYTPHVLGVQRYQPIAVLNSDTLLHNVHSAPVNQQGFNFGQPVAGMENMVQFREEEVMVPVKCDVPRLDESLYRRRRPSLLWRDA